MERRKILKAITTMLLISLAISTINAFVGVQANPPPAPTYSFTATISPTEVDVNQLITYTVTITNTGTHSLGSASIAIPAGFTVLSPITILAPPSSWKYTLSTVAINLTGNNGGAAIGSGENVIFTFAAITSAALGATTWTATANSNTGWGGTTLTLGGTEPTVTVNSLPVAPTISASPNTINQGQISLLSQLVATSGGTLPYTYQWLESFGGGPFSPITGANGPSYTFSTTTSTAIGTWSFKLNVTDSSGVPVTVTSNTVNVVVNSALAAPAVTATPNAVYQIQTSTLTSSPVTTGTSPYTYQWFQKAPSGDYTTVGSNSPSYTFPGSMTLGTWAFLLQVTDRTGASVNSSAVDITVSFTPLFTVNVTQGAHGTINPGTTSVFLGGNQSFTISPDIGYHIADVLVDNVSVGAITSYTFTSVTADHRLTATFTQIEYTLTVSVVGSGSVARSPSQATYHYGDVVQLSASPASGWSFGGWNGDLTGSLNPSSITIDGNKAVTATFAINQYTITPSAGANGAINPSTPQTIDFGATPSFTVTPNVGYHVLDVTVDGVSVLGNLVDNVYTFPAVSASHTIAATFAINQFTITASAGAGGSINPLGTTIVDYGGSQAFTITPSVGYHVVDVLVDGSSVGAVLSYTFSNVQADHLITTSFAIDTSIIDASAGSNGSINPNGIVIVNYGDDEGFTITPDLHYHVADVLVDGISVGAVTSYTFTDVTADHTIYATFAVDTLTILASAGPNGSINPNGIVIVNYGDDEGFTITPDAHYHVANVLVDKVSVGAVTSYVFNVVTADHDISVTFEIDHYIIDASAGPHGTINPVGTVVVNWNATQGFTITPDAYYHIANVMVDGVSVGPVTSYTFTQVAANHNIIATFAINTYFINVTSSHGTPTPSAKVNAGDNFTASVTSPEGDTSHRWICTGYSIDGGAPTSGTSYSFINIQADHTITFNWQEQYYLTVLSARGSTTGNGWYNSGANATASLSSGKASGGIGIQYIFTGWSGDVSGLGLTSNSLTMNGPKIATADWKTQYYLTVTSTHGNPTGQGWYDAGSTANFGTASTVSGGSGTRYVFNSWAGTGSGSYTGSAVSSSVTMNGPLTEQASWTTQYQVTYISSGNVSSVAVPSTEWVNYGKAATGTFPTSITNAAGNAKSNFVSDNRPTAITTPTTVTGTYQTQYLVTFSQNGLDSDAQGTVVTIFNDAKEYNQLANTTWINSGSSVTFNFEETVESTDGSKQYVLTSTNTTSPLVVNDATTVQGNYQTQTSSSLYTIVESALILFALALLAILLIAWLQRRKKKITPLAGAGGSISPNTTQKVNSGGDSPTFKITPSSDYHIVDVIIDEITHLGAVRTYQFTDVTDDHTISASFDKN